MANLITPLRSARLANVAKLALASIALGLATFSLPAVANSDHAVCAGFSRGSVACAEASGHGSADRAAWMAAPVWSSCWSLVFTGDTLSVACSMAPPAPDCSMLGGCWSSPPTQPCSQSSAFTFAFGSGAGASACAGGSGSSTSVVCTPAGCVTSTIGGGVSCSAPGSGCSVHSSRGGSSCAASGAFASCTAGR
jgi:hypothetical protein